MIRGGAKWAVLLTLLSPFVISGALAWNTIGQANPTVDAEADPLPSGALARLGTTRFRFDGAAHLEFAPDGNTLFSSTLDQRVVEWGLTTGRQRARLFESQFGSTTADNPFRTVSNALSPGANTLAQEVINADGQFHSAIRVWDTVSGKELRSFGNVGRVRCLTFSPDANLLASGSAGGRREPGAKGGLRLWNPATGTEVIQFERPNLDVFSIAFSPDGKSLASTDSDELKTSLVAGTIRLWDIKAGKELKRWENNAVGVSCIFSPDGRSIASEDTNAVRILATDTGKEQLRLRRVFQTLFRTTLAYSPSGRILAVAAPNSSLSVAATAPPGDARVDSCAVHLWDALSGQEIRRIHVPSASYVTVMAFSPDGRTLATGGGVSGILLWDVTAPVKDGQVKPAVLSPDILASLWADLAGDGVKADQAIWTLARASQQSGPFLKERLRLTPVTAEQLTKLIAELDSNQFTVRQKAAKTLEVLGDAARLTLRKALGTPLPLEVKQRIETILAHGDMKAIRTLRAVESLEHIGTAEARQTLQEMTKRDTRVAEAAEASLKRLASRGR
jgi:WD40 repeat protein